MLFLIKKEIKDYFKSKTSVILFILLSLIIAYSFYSATDLYSKASVSAINNPLYAAGFEPSPGVFVPTFGGLFIILSLITPFLLIQSISNEKKLNTIVLMAQFPYSLFSVFISKIISAVSVILISILSFTPLFYIWHSLGGHIPWAEILLLSVGYLLYGLFIISISFFSSSVFQTSSQASIFSLAFIMISWFLDFGKEMNIAPFLTKLSNWSITSQLKHFEDGILSVESVFYFILIFLFFSLLSFVFFNFSIKNKIKWILIIFITHLILFVGVSSINKKRDLTESGRNSFSKPINLFLRKLPKIKIKIFLNPTDSRYKDYENDFLKKIEMVKTDIKLIFAKGDKLKRNYGIFEYTINGQSDRTYSNSEEEIFIIFQKLTGLKIKKGDNDKTYKGYPLIVKKLWYKPLFFIYLILFPLLILFIYYKLNNRSWKNDKKL